MSNRERTRHFLFQVAPALVMACVFIAANMRPYYEGPFNLDAFRCYGFPYAYRFDNVVNWQSVFGDGGTIDDPRDDIIWNTTFDDVGIIADIGVGVWLIGVTVIVTYVVRQRTLDATPSADSGK
jgi:hypothetical protein